MKFTKQKDGKKNFSLWIITKKGTRKLAACDRDLFILFTTTKVHNFILPINFGIVESSNWKEYFGSFAGRDAVVGPLNITYRNPQIITISNRY